MKKLTSLALSLAIMASAVVPASAANVGEVVDYALHTDIVAQINGHPLRSYNVGGRTAVVAEDLVGYGFKVSWNGVERTLDVQRAVDERGKVTDPNIYPKFEAETLRAPIGSRAEKIYATDIKTYVAKEQVDGFNIDGQTMIWFSDLDSYGDVVWDGETRTANLVLGDPVKHSMEKVVQPLLDLVGADAKYQLYTGDCGSVFVGYYTGTTHGAACQMVYVDRAGNRMDIDALLPANGFGAAYYINPRNVFIDNNQLYFSTTMGDQREHQIHVDLAKGILADTRPINHTQTLGQWRVDAQLDAAQEAMPQQALEITLTKNAGEEEISIADSSFPYASVKVQMTQKKIVVIPGHSGDAEFDKTPFGRAYRALVRSDLPSVYEGEPITTKNTETQRNLVKRFFAVTYNGKSVAGSLWWTGRGGRPAMQFDFDHSVSMKDGDKLTLWIGAK